MIKLYAYKKCSTCRNAEKFFEKNNIPFEFIDITLQPPAAGTLKKILKSSGKDIKKLLNTSGIVYREMELKNKIDEMSHDEIFNLLAKNGKLIKRPIAFDNSISTIGFKEDEYKEKWL